jgi:hypothetical protein
MADIDDARLRDPFPDIEGATGAGSGCPATAPTAWAGLPPPQIFPTHNCPRYVRVPHVQKPGQHGPKQQAPALGQQGSGLQLFAVGVGYILS